MLMSETVLARCELHRINRGVGMGPKAPGYTKGLELTGVVKKGAVPIKSRHASILDGDKSLEGYADNFRVVYSLHYSPMYNVLLTRDQQLP